MKIGKKTKNPELTKSAKPVQNKAKNFVFVLIVVAITAGLIVWVYSMGVKATEAVTVVMTTKNLYKNQVITADCIQPYDMLKAEFEKFSITNKNGTAQRRIILWSEKDQFLGAFAAYPIAANTYLESRSLYRSRIDNSDTILYSYPGKEVIQLSLGSNDLNTFKTFLEPNDRVNINATWTEKEKVVEMTPYGQQEVEVETFKSDVIFQDIMVADLLNKQGDSILDIYQSYNAKTVSQQAALDSDSQFLESTKPTNLLVALTPEEKKEYYYYLNKDNISFSMTLPQRVE